MDRCEQIGLMLDAYHDRELGVLGRWRVARHLARCASCRRSLDEIEHVGSWVREALADATPPDLGPELWADIAARLPAAAPAPRRSLGALLPRWDFALPAGAATLVAAAFCGVLLWQTQLAEPPAALPEGVVRSLNAHGRSVMVLDGPRAESTIIWLMDEAAEPAEELASVWI